jgi:hypothetical protein
MKKEHKWILIALIAYSCAVTAYIFNKSDEYPQDAESAVISRETSFDENGRQTVDIRVRRQSRDMVPAGLRQAVNKTTESAVRIKTVTRIDTVLVPDTVYISDGCDTIHISKTIKNDWIQVAIHARRDSIGFALKVYNDMTVSVANKRRLLRPDEARITVQNCNPYTVSTGEQVWVLKREKKRWWAWLLAGALTGAIITQQTR